jgi:ABC-type multidrug transport system ATPase subunit
LVGPNGSGKSTVLHLLAGIRKPSSGTVLINGEPFSRVRQYDNAPRFVSLLQNPARQLVGESIRAELRNWIWDGQHKVPFEEDIVDVVCCALGGINSNSDPRSLSFGWQRVFTLLCCLCSDADVFVIDEPELGLDSSMQEFAIDMVRILAFQLNRVVVLSCHSLSFVEQIAKTVAVLQRGQVVFVGDTKEALSRVWSITI